MRPSLPRWSASRGRRRLTTGLTTGLAAVLVGSALVVPASAGTPIAAAAGTVAPAGTGTTAEAAPIQVVDGSATQGGLLASAASADLAAPACAERVLLGHSRKGRRIVACHLVGSSTAQGGPMLVVGSMHGDETAGKRITARLRERDLTGTGADIWVISTINPDGTRLGRRGNARRVDLNGNFPTKGWSQRMRGTIFWGGPRAASEPETRALMQAVRTIRPTRVVVFHQHANVIDCPPYRSRSLTRTLHRLTGYDIRCMPVLTGNFTAWANQRFDQTTAMTFELEAHPRAARLARVVDGLVTIAGRADG